jgi:hypothetical protein
LTWLNRLAVASLVSCVAAIALDLRRRVRGRDMDAT